MSRPAEPRVDRYVTKGGIAVARRSLELPEGDVAEPLVRALDHKLGCFFSSSVEFPGRYSRWDIGFKNPPVMIVGRGRSFRIQALNARGKILMRTICGALEGADMVEALIADDGVLSGRVSEPAERFPEEQRSRQPSLFSVLRRLVDLFASGEEPHLGLYGAFGYDLAFQFERIRQRLPRSADQRDLVLYLPDEILAIDHQRHQAMLYQYEFVVDGYATADLARDGGDHPFRLGNGGDAVNTDHAPGEYPAIVGTAKESFARGDLFEVVPGQTFGEATTASPSRVFDVLKDLNPAPYGALMNLGEGEFLVSASPEMFVRVDGRRIETCPISGTIARGRDAIADAGQILKLLNSAKDAAELTMCTDVDRNDKARVCEPGSVRVIGRRQIEMYSRLIHTVDHVEGHLREGYDALDGFLTHAWAVTVTGAPKLWAMQFLEDHEKSPRRWYGGAIGWIGFNGNLNTGLTLRTIRMKDGIAEVRAGATLLFDSDPESEDAECKLKASAMLAAIRSAGQAPKPKAAAQAKAQPGKGLNVLLVDHEDSFVHMLADYIRQTGAQVTTLRHGLASEAIKASPPDLVVLSPGPGRPSDFAMTATLDAALGQSVPIFGVCLGLQGLVEHFGGSLGQLDVPMHGKASVVALEPGRFLAGLPERFTVGRYHSLFAKAETLPPRLLAMAKTEDGVIMAIEHKDLAIAAVQFHPESILTLEDGVGLRLIGEVISRLTGRREPTKRTEG
ncbi:MAG: anthranilate synthase component I [Alphaproteobacteria bacterium]|nr:anthranilate synthase component I [Alphaproteobacteria bacterium]